MAMTNINYIKAKSYIDTIICVALLIIALPFLILISIILTVILRSSPLIIQKRGITMDSKMFNFYKFKTINIDPNYQVKNENILFKSELSQYVPTFCKWLRITGLDELPQIFNVLKRDMSLIGPRPLTMTDLSTLKNNFPHYYNERKSIRVKPGITGMWQVFGNRNKGIENLINLDLYYNKQISLSIDLRILYSTFFLVSAGKHCDAICNTAPKKRIITTNKKNEKLNGVLIKQFVLTTNKL